MTIFVAMALAYTPMALWVYTELKSTSSDSKLHNARTCHTNLFCQY
jgi:hypothetical protein